MSVDERLLCVGLVIISLALAMAAVFLIMA